MMQGDEIIHQRQQAERDAALDPRDGNYLFARGLLALFVCAEQLYEIRANLETLVDRSDK